MKSKKLAKWVFSICFFVLGMPSANARQKFASLPGGLLYPQFATAAFSNAAALTSDWYSEVQALYSPALSDQSPNHSYLLGYGTSNPQYGFNLGYAGSADSGVTAHNLFMGISRRMKKHSFGLSLRRNDLIYSNQLPVDVSWMWDISKYFSLGLVGYDVAKNRTVGFGLGLKDSNSNSIEADIQFPLPGYPEPATREYSANLASVIFFNNAFGVSLGTRYQKWVVSNTVSATLRHTFGTVMKFNKQVSLVGLYTSSPDTVTVGFCWGSPATSQQWTEYWLERDRRGINQ